MSRARDKREKSFSRVRVARESKFQNTMNREELIEVVWFVKNEDVLVFWEKTPGTTTLARLCRFFCSKFVSRRCRRNSPLFLWFFQISRIADTSRSLCELLDNFLVVSYHLQPTTHNEQPHMEVFPCLTPKKKLT